MAAMAALRRMIGLVDQPDLRPGPLPATRPARRECNDKTAETRALMQLGRGAARVREKRRIRSALALTGSEDGWLRVVAGVVLRGAAPRASRRATGAATSER